MTWENSHFANEVREDLSNSVKMDLHSCASSLSTLPNLCEANILSMWTVRPIFNKFPPLAETDRMKERNEDTGCALSLSHPRETPCRPQVSRFHHVKSYSKG